MIHRSLRLILTGVIWDTGLGYRTESGSFAATSVPAARAMMLYFANADVLPSLVTIGRTVRASICVNDGIFQ